MKEGENDSGVDRVGVIRVPQTGKISWLIIFRNDGYSPRTAGSVEGSLSLSITGFPVWYPGAIIN